MHLENLLLQKKKKMSLRTECQLFNFCLHTLNVCERFKKHFLITLHQLGNAQIHNFVCEVSKTKLEYYHLSFACEN